MAQYSFLKFSEDGKKIIKCDNGVTGHIDIPVGITHISPEAFEYCSGIESISIPNTIKSIGRDAFSSCHNLRDVYISDLSAWLSIRFEGSCTLDGLAHPQSMANPLWYAKRLFLNNEIVEDLVIPEGIESICDYAFCLYEGLKSITFPKSLKTIGHGAFFRCNLESVQFFDNLHFVGFHSFQECKNLRIVSFSDGVSTIGDCIGEYAFKGCINLSSISLPQSFTSIGQSAFEDCEKLELVNIPNVQDLSNSCFKGCRTLSSIELPPSLIRIGCACFYDTALSYIRIPKSVSDIYPFANINIYIDVEPGNENYISEDGSLYNTKYDRRGKMLVKYFCSSPNVSIKDVRHIGSNAFSGCKLLKSIIIDGPVDSIGSAFRGCDNLEEIILPNGITRIDGFDGCKKLSNIVIPESVVVIGERAFKDCTSLKKIVLPSQLIRIENSAFFGCTNIVEIVMPNSIEVIDEFAFKDCKTLTHIEIPNGVKKIGSEAFYGCTNLVEIAMPNSIEEIGNCALKGCKSLPHIKIPNGVRKIGSEAFYGCSGLTSIFIPDSVKSIGRSAFAYCSAITTLCVANDNMTYDSRDSCNAVIKTATNSLIAGCKNTIIPDGVKTIGDFAFNGCTELIKISIPDGVTSIGELAFCNCANLSSIRIPSSVTNIGYCIFRWCNKLSEIIIPEGSKTQFEKLLGKDKLVEQEQMTERGIKCRILFFDTETTGIPLNYKAPSSDTQNWPRLVQLAWILTDENGNRILTGNLIVKPDGFNIPADASKVHGISTERAKEEGVPLAEVIERFKSDLNMATYIVGHNIEFDKKIVGAEMIRLGMKDELEKKKSYCTMQSSIDFCKIPGKYGYKYPKLQELYKKLFGNEFDDAHNAMSDIEATEKCFWELRKRKLI